MAVVFATLVEMYWFDYLERALKQLQTDRGWGDRRLKSASAIDVGEITELVT